MKFNGLVNEQKCHKKINSNTLLANFHSTSNIGIQKFENAV